ncbi:MAG TPA: endo alpha-1,4 polygalactosaminidase [Polyangiales bacterium]|nr:endo alpha-1,4 polygalactosaminidase [Polyangiales bacterium]
MLHPFRCVPIAALLSLSWACSGASKPAPPPRDAGAADARAGGSQAGKRGGSGGRSGSGAGGAVAADGGAAATYFKPALGSSWQIQYVGALDTSFDVQIYDLDLADTPQARIDELHAKGRKVICYFDTAYEAWRTDATTLEPYRGNPLDGWPDQYWLDIREPAVFDVMLARLDLAKSKKCDAVDADDVDARSNNPGFPLTANDQQSFIKRLAAAAHARGLGFGLKNDLEEISALLDHVDFAVNEECFEQAECDELAPFIRAGKPVFNVEYTDGDMAAKSDDICADAKRRKFSTLIKRWNLSAERVACP